MSIQNLEKYLPANTLDHLKNWFGDYSIHIKITKERNSKLGDYRRMPDKSHQITINSTLQAPLFFFVLTHELAHLIAFDRYSYRISAHGAEWKNTFKIMLLESISVYPIDLQPIIFKFSKAPKASFMASPDLVRYFQIENLEDEQSYVEELEADDCFTYRNEVYMLLEKRKKNYLCKNLGNGKNYIFKPLARVEKLS